MVASHKWRLLFGENIKYLYFYCCKPFFFFLSLFSNVCPSPDPFPLPPLYSSPLHLQAMYNARANGEVTEYYGRLSLNHRTNAQGSAHNTEEVKRKYFKIDCTHTMTFAARVFFLPKSVVY